MIIECLRFLDASSDASFEKTEKKKKSNKSREECMRKIAKQSCNGSLRERFITLREEDNHLTTLSLSYVASFSQTLIKSY